MTDSQFWTDKSIFEGCVCCNGDKRKHCELTQVFLYILRGPVCQKI